MPKVDKEARKKELLKLTKSQLIDKCTELEFRNYVFTEFLSVHPDLEPAFIVWKNFIFSRRN